MIFSIFKKKKDFRAQISPSEQEITINKGETLLAGALRSGLAWPISVKLVVAEPVDAK